MGWSKSERNLLQRADKHMRKLEAAGGNALKFAYSRLQKDLERLGVSKGKGGKRRLDRAAPEDQRKQRALLNSARRFLESQTSTPAAIKRLEKRNLERFNNKMGTSLSLTQYAAVAEIYDRFSGGSYKVTQVIKAVERHDAGFLRDLGAVVDNQVDAFGVPESISSKSDLLDAVLDALGENLSEWKTSEIIPH